MKMFMVRGFTLIELMVVVAIVGIIASIAYPSYVGYMNQARRADAMTTLIQLQLAQERYRANNPLYGTLANLGFAAVSPEGNYALTVVLQADASLGYTATATAQAAQAGDNACATLSLNQDGPVVTTAAQQACWNR